MKEQLNIRRADENDLELLFALIKEMALYEKRPEDVVGNADALGYWLFERCVPWAYIAEYEGSTAGYAICYPVFGSFSTAGRVHLEDIYIREPLRRRGLGRAFFAHIAAGVLEEGYAGLEWNCLSWNKDALDFYARIGACRETGRDYLFFSKGQLETLAAVQK